MVYWQWLGSTIFCETTEGYTGQVGVGTQGPTITLTLLNTGIDFFCITNIWNTDIWNNISDITNIWNNLISYGLLVL